MSTGASGKRAAKQSRWPRVLGSGMVVVLAVLTFLLPSCTGDSTEEAAEDLLTNPECVEGGF